MGNKVNSEQFRLGISVNWKYQLREPLVVIILVLKTIQNMFLQYSAPYVKYNIRRNTNPREVKECGKVEKGFTKSLKRSLSRLNRIIKFKNRLIYSVPYVTYSIRRLLRRKTQNVKKFLLNLTNLLTIPHV